ncbi:MucR family transcriptional regulator [Caulobacter segnis]|uniref:MucR family transcriptional regulator n=1 Tax=Caulobacter segnis TaxID=88688 RepID=UPI001CBFFDF5|nr:MucR family transcriptional regulator [Caulobacter segnis]UAL11060.1 MucR family transcriptional regulator [Caulobacter segnis]
MTLSRIPGLTARIISAYVSANTVAGDDLPVLIRQVGEALDSVERPIEVPEAPPRPTPGAIRRSVRHDALVSFLDGRAYKTLRRHLNRHGLTEADYRARFGLPSDYPMTATEYRERRSAMAKAAGLGHGRQRPAS